MAINRDSLCLQSPLVQDTGPCVRLRFPIKILEAAHEIKFSLADSIALFDTPSIKHAHASIYTGLVWFDLISSDYGNHQLLRQNNTYTARHVLEDNQLQDFRTFLSNFVTNYSGVTKEVTKAVTLTLTKEVTLTLTKAR